MKTNGFSGRVIKGINVLLICMEIAIGSCTSKSVTLPVLTTDNVNGITRTAAASGGNITSDGGASITSRGVCWSTSSNPTTSDSKTDNGAGVGPFTADLTNLTPNTTYNVRAYATNSDGTNYGNQVTFTTPLTSVATLITTSVTSITSTTATSGGDITSDGGLPVTLRGICWSTAQNPTTSNDTTSNGSGSGIFISHLKNLSATTTYYVRSYAVNSDGTAYGNQVSLLTKVAGPPPNEVYIQGFAFNPVTITVVAGTTITWTNKDAVAHTVTSDTGAFDSGSIAANGTYSRTFSTTGTFAYHCTFHAGMNATVVVN
jgi:plastocyanin